MNIYETRHYKTWVDNLTEDELLKLAYQKLDRQQFYLANKEAIQARNREWYAKNREKVKRKQRIYHHAHRPRVLYSRGVYRDYNRETLNQKENQRVADLDDYYVRAELKRRTGRPINSFTAEEIEARRQYLKAKRGRVGIHPCPYCGKPGVKNGKYHPSGNPKFLCRPCGRAYGFKQLPTKVKAVTKMMKKAPGQI